MQISVNSKEYMHGVRCTKQPGNAKMATGSCK